MSAVTNGATPNEAFSAAELATLLALATQVAEEAADLLRTRRAHGVRVSATKSNELDIVTEADGAAEELIRARILSVRPDDGFLGEEGETLSGTSGVTWVVDPLDGTVNYLYGSGPYAVSIAAVSCDRESGLADPATWIALVGVVVVCTENITYVASRGGGAFANGQPIAVSREEKLEFAIVTTGLSYDRLARRDQIAVAGRVAASARDLRMSGSAAADLCLVASARVGAYYERYLGPWDFAAGALIVQEAGGSVGGVGAGAPSSDLVLASAPGIVSALRAVML
jgi:myo-inositol-1(or 4)-monophosphatase